MSVLSGLVLTGGLRMHRLHLSCANKAAPLPFVLRPSFDLVCGKYGIQIHVIHYITYTLVLHHFKRNESSSTRG